jgi:hypothetical protein
MRLLEVVVLLVSQELSLSAPTPTKPLAVQLRDSTYIKEEEATI